LSLDRVLALGAIEGQGIELRPQLIADALDARARHQIEPLDGLGEGQALTEHLLGILIPPSIVMLVYSAATEVSAARMFMAGFIPGIMMGGLLMLAIYIVARINHLPSQPWPGFREVASAGFRASGGILLIVIVLGSIYGGVASPTEAAAVSAIYAFLVSVIGYRDMRPLKSTPWRRDGVGAGAMLLRNGWQVPLAIGQSVGSTAARVVQTSLDDPFGRLRQRDESAYQQMRDRLREAGITERAAIEAVFRRARRDALLFAGSVVLVALMPSALLPRFAPLILAVALLALAMAVKATLRSRRLLGRLLADTDEVSAP
jgi:hypothetical protein